MIRRYLALSVVALTLLAVAQAQEENDVEGGRDHPLLSRMPGFYLSSFDEKDFDSLESAYVTGPEAVWEGKTTRLGYSIKTGAKPVSMTQIGRNYENAVRKIGGTILYTEGRVVCARVQRDKAVTYVQVAAFNDGTQYELVIVESKPMDQDVTADATALGRSIAETGKAAVYGIFFDTGLSTIKPESNAVLDEIAKLLAQQPKLGVYVVGHTDNTGTLESNLKLSADRAASVVKALVGRGVAAARMKPAGAGPYCPEAPNSTEEGRAKNRRVELVQMN